MFNKTEIRHSGLREEQELYVTVTGFCHYYEKKPFAIGNLIRCRKEPDNCHDAEAIKCTLPMLGTVGYIANSTYTVAGGTMSAGRIYDKVDEKFYIRVMFVTSSKVICKVERGDRDQLRRELDRQQKKDEWED